MKRRVVSLITTLALCLNLCPMWVSAADEGAGVGLCPHHQAHTDECGYAPGDPGAPCTFVCKICPVNDLISEPPDSVSADNSEQMEAQLSKISDLYGELTEDEQEQVNLSASVSLQNQTDEGDAGTEIGSTTKDYIFEPTSDMEFTTPYEVSVTAVIDTKEYTLMWTMSTALQVTETGKLYLKGTIKSNKGVGVEVASGGFLSIEGPNTVILGSTYALDVASDAEIHLSGGTFTGKTAAAIRIRTKDGESADFAALLEPGHAYFDTSGNPILPADIAQKTKVVVDQCTDHSGRTYTHTPGVTAHTWTCPYCGVEETEACTFTFDQNGKGTCDFCDNTITIAVDEDDLTGLVYDGTVKPEDISITVTLADGSDRKLVADTDYEVDYEPRIDVGEITVTVTGLTFSGTFTKTYHVEQDQPGISWDADACSVNYGGSPVDSASLPHITITIKASEDLYQYLQYFWKTKGAADTEFTAGLPTNAGEYEIKAYIPESQNYKAAETDPYLTLTINKIPAVTTAPTAKTLTYNRAAQELVTAGALKPGAAAEGAKIEYKLGTNGTYSTGIPTGVGVSTYAVWYRIEDTENYTGQSGQLSARINHKEITPTVELEYYTTLYTGEDKEPAVTVKDGEAVIPNSEYTVTYGNNRKAGTATVTVTNKQNGNYRINTATAKFQITLLTQNPLSIVTDISTDIHYGDTFRLSAVGGSGSGAIQWSIAQTGNIASIDSNGVVTVKGVGGFTVQAYRAAADSYGVSNTASVSFDAKPKSVTPTVTADEKPYDGTTNATLHAAWKNGDLVGEDKIPLTVEGEFVSADVGDSKTVMITKKEPVGASGNYFITWPDSATASIYKVDAEIENAPQPENRDYDTTEQPLVSTGTMVNGIGKIVYSLSRNGVYSENVPTATNAGAYTVWYKVADSVNYTGIPAAAVEVEIAKADPTITNNSPATSTKGQTLSEIPLEDIVSADIDGKFAWKDDDSIEPVDGAEYDVIFTPDDTANYNEVTIKVQVTVTDPPETDPPETDPPETDPPETEPPVTEPPETGQPDPGNNTSNTPSSRPDTPSAETNTSGTPTQTTTTVQDGTASTVVSAADGNMLVQEAVENQSQNVVIQPEITGDVTKVEVSIPSSMVSQLGSETNAALTVSTPVADVTISNEALDTLGQAGDTVNVVVEQVEQSVVLTLTAGGETVEQVPGGLTLTVPVENAGPGTVAVLVHEDGTRETVRNSIVEDGVMSIPLSGSATVEIVDNSKDFDDVPPESWEADAVDFASSHELFNGTSETTFSPDQAMSRAMLATVLYRLEGQPDQDQPVTFRDVESDAWYAEGVAWAAENGIAGGYGEDQFGPDENITREQFVVMLWRYVGSPEASGEGLDFTDADQASSYALEALSWAVENGILNGYGNGQLDPGGIVTRAQAAQLLKNLMENT